MKVRGLLNKHVIKYSQKLIYVEFVFLHEARIRKVLNRSKLFREEHIKRPEEA
jgi:hypothetical protein